MAVASAGPHASFAPYSRQITMPAPHHSIFYKPDVLPNAQPTVSRHWRQKQTSNEVQGFYWPRSAVLVPVDFVNGAQDEPQSVTNQLCSLLPQLQHYNKQAQKHLRVKDIKSKIGHRVTSINQSDWWDCCSRSRCTDSPSNVRVNQWLKYKFGGPGTLKKFGALL